MAKEKTVTDYNIRVSKIKQEYLKRKMDFNLNYNFTEENFDTFTYFLITNITQATKIIFDSEHGVIIEKEIYTTDIHKITELQGKL